MGYRSDVKILFSAKTKAEVDQFLVRMKIEEKLTDDMLSWCSEEQIGNGLGWLLSFESVKWYEDFEEVIAWTELMKQADVVSGMVCEFLRIGEEETDIEHEHYGVNEEDNLYIRRTVEVSF